MPGEDHVSDIGRLEHSLEIVGQGVDGEWRRPSRADAVAALVVESTTRWPCSRRRRATGIQTSWLQPQQWGSTTTDASGPSPGRSQTASSAPSGVRTMWWSGLATPCPHPSPCRPSSGVSPPRAARRCRAIPAAAPAASRPPDRSTRRPRDRRFVRSPEDSEGRFVVMTGERAGRRGGRDQSPCGSE